jgi:hypothetical protein
MSQEAFHYIDKPQVLRADPTPAPAPAPAPAKVKKSHKMLLKLILLLAILALIYGGYCMYKSNKSSSSKATFYF